MNVPIDFTATPLVPVVVQDDRSREVLMVGFMNRLAYERTQATGSVHFWSRSRDRLWQKGETSGHTLDVVSIALNCEDNSLLVQVNPRGAICHTGHVTCFYRQVLPDGTLLETSDPVFDPSAVYLDQARAETSGSGSGASERGTLIALWYGAYEFLDSEQLAEISATSRLLRERTRTDQRIADELEELTGVISGKHAHAGELQTDVLLEGSQVFYWLTVQSVQLGLTWDADLDLQDALFVNDQGLNVVQPFELLSGLAQQWRMRSGESLGDDKRSSSERTAQLKETYRRVSEAVAPIVGSPMKLIERDLRDLQGRPYLKDYFTSARV